MHRTPFFFAPSLLFILTGCPQSSAAGLSMTIEVTATEPGQPTGRGPPSATVEYTRNIEQRENRVLSIGDCDNKARTHVGLLSETCLQGILSPRQLGLACVGRGIQQSREVDSAEVAEYHRCEHDQMETEAQANAETVAEMTR